MLVRVPSLGHELHAKCLDDVVCPIIGIPPPDCLRHDSSCARCRIIVSPHPSFVVHNRAYFACVLLVCVLFCFALFGVFSGDDQARDFRGKTPADVIGEREEVPEGGESNDELRVVITRTLAGGADLAQDAVLAADEVGLFNPACHMQPAPRHRWLLEETSPTRSSRRLQVPYGI